MMEGAGGHGRPKALFVFGAAARLRKHIKVLKSAFGTESKADKLMSPNKLLQHRVGGTAIKSARPSLDMRLV